MASIPAVQLEYVNAFTQIKLLQHSKLIMEVFIRMRYITKCFLESMTLVYFVWIEYIHMFMIQKVVHFIAYLDVCIWYI